MERPLQYIVFGLELKHSFFSFKIKNREYIIIFNDLAEILIAFSFRRNMLLDQVYVD